MGKEYKKKAKNKEKIQYIYQSYVQCVTGLTRLKIHFVLKTSKTFTFQDAM